MIQISRRGLAGSPSAVHVKRSRAAFKQKHFLRLASFVSGELLSQVGPKIARARAARVQDAGGSESEVLDSPETAALIFLLNEPKLLKCMSRLTGVRGLKAFVGRAYRLLPSRRDSMDWHSDMLKRRKLALSINLSRRPYSGGALELRHAASKRSLGRIPNRRYGQALLFRVSKRLEHRVRPVQGRAPKIAFSGWFTA